jgi:hypothetical protein
MSSLFDRAPEILKTAALEARGENYAWGLLLLVLSSETEAACCKESAKAKNDERLTAHVG